MADQNEERVRINLGTLVRRLKILSQPYQPGASEDEAAQADFIENNEYKAFYTVGALLDALDRIDRKEEPFRNRPGLHLRGFRSRIDDQVMHYRLFVPTNYRPDGAGLPLVIVPATTFVRPGPFIESAFVAAHKEAEKWASTAEKLGLGILWPGYRVQPYGAPLEFTHFDEVMAEVAADYRIDPSRLYLYGFCSSGMIAAMEVARQPGRYAAMAHLNPVLHRVKGRYADSGDFARNATYRAWLQETDPVNVVAGMRDLPVWIIHDGEDPDHGPLSHSVDFVELSRALGGRPRFEHNKNQPAARRAAKIDRQFTWLAAQRRAQPMDFRPVPAPAGGPLARAFAERVVVVRGTVGDPASRVAAARWCRAFEEAWERTNYGPCRVIDDVQLTGEEEKTSNLVLIGNPETNAVWQRMAEQLPAKVGKSEVTANGQTWRGEGLALQTWCFHPTHSARKIVLVGAADLERAAVGTMELALDGWFDFAVWRGGSGKPELAEAGRFQRGEINAEQ